MTAELHIILGLNCNFSCSHCLNNSRPGYRDFDIQPVEISVLKKDIEKNVEIEQITFSGGEPLLYMGLIEDFVLHARNLKNRKNIKFSITTNGSLLPKYSNLLKDLKIDYCTLSYDSAHSNFIDKDAMTNSAKLASELFQHVEINFVYEAVPEFGLIEDLASEIGLKVNFNNQIYSGRSKGILSPMAETHTTIKCPNFISTEMQKITYVPKRGYTICSGPVIFDNIVEDNFAFSNNFKEVYNTRLYQISNALLSSEVKMSEDLDCNKCRKLFSMKKLRPHLNGMLSINSWDNYVEMPDLNADDLVEIETLYYPKYVMSAKAGSWHYIPNEKEKTESLHTFFGTKISRTEIEEFSDFTIKTFYNIHTSHYSQSDINSFKANQEIFFSLPFHIVRHEINGQIIGYLAVCLLDNHQFFKEPTWHIGYWGIDKNIKDKALRSQIKDDWSALLKGLNNKYRVAANIDYFNKPAYKISAGFGMITHGYRLDPRQK